MNFFQGLKSTFKNKAFLLFTVMFFLHEYILQVLATITPLFVVHVFNISDAVLISVFYIVYFLMALVSMIFWMKLDTKIGSKKTFTIAIIVFFFMLIPFLFITSFSLALIFAAFMGIGFGGMMYTIWLLIADVIDDDELKTGIRREGIFFGITNFFIRFAVIASIVTISLVYTTTGWETYTPNPGADIIFGNRIIFVVFPSIALGLTLLCLYFYPLSKERVEELKLKLVEIHKKKKDQVRSQLK
jgi:GPH family glycoside/pentoside/hexuronide:cation symporter